MTTNVFQFICILFLTHGLNLIAADQFQLHPISDNQAILIKSLYMVYILTHDWLMPEYLDQIPLLCSLTVDIV